MESCYRASLKQFHFVAAFVVFLFRSHDNTHLLSFANVPRLIYALFTFPANEAVQWQHTCSIPTPWPVWQYGICFHIGIPPALLLSKFPPSPTFLYHTLSSVLFFSDHVTTSASKASPVLWTWTQTGIVCIYKCARQSVAPPGLFVIAATEIWRLTGKRLMCRPLKIPLSILCMPCIWIARIARMQMAAVNRITHRLHAHTWSCTRGHSRTRTVVTTDDLMLLKDCFHSCLCYFLVLGAE